MTEQTLNKEILNYLRLLDSSQKSFVLNLIKFLFNSKDANVKRITRRQYNKEIDVAVKQIAKGRFITHEDLEKESEKW